MRFIPTRVHGILDYLEGGLLLILGMVTPDPALKPLCLIAGLGVLLMAALTRYELGIIKLIPMSAHLAMDVLLGVLLLGVAGQNWRESIGWVVVLLGALTIGGAFLTKTGQEQQASQGRTVLR